MIMEKQDQPDRLDEFKDNIDELQFWVKEYINSKKFKEIIEFIGKFRYLAPYNAMLVNIQKPGATFVFKGDKWLKYHRQIKLNAQPLLTLIPFGPVQAMFDYSDTEPIPGYEDVAELQKIKEWEDALMQAEGYIETEALSNLIGNLPLYGIYLDDNFSASNSFCGYIKNDTRHIIDIHISAFKSISYHSVFSISLNKNYSDNVKFHTLCHELGHLFCCHLQYGNGTCRNLSNIESEFEAETVAWLVCKRHGIDNPSEEYLANYAEGDKIPVCSFDHVLKAVTEIEKMMKSILSITDSKWYKKDKDFKKAIQDVM